MKRGRENPVHKQATREVKNMDTSEQYIKMCEKDEEIQKLDRYAYFDYYADPESRRTFRGDNNMDSGKNIMAFSVIKHEKFIWLPTQDRLQEMVIRGDWGNIPLFAVDQIETFRRKTSFQNYPYYQKWFATQEQLWLAFVMKEKFGKVWNGEDWI